MSVKIYDNIKGLDFFATGTCADIYITNDKKFVVKVVKLNNKHEFQSKKRAIKSVYAEHELINMVGIYKSYGVHISKKYGYITMDKVSGRSLSDIMQYNEYLEIDPKNVINILKDWTKQVKTIHDYGVCHYSLHRSNLFIDKNRGYIIDYGNSILDSYYDNEYKYLVSSDKLKNNNRGIHHTYQDFRFFLKNCKKFVENVYTQRGSNDYVKIKSIYSYIRKNIKILENNPKPKYNYAIDFFKFLNTL